MICLVCHKHSLLTILGQSCTNRNLALAPPNRSRFCRVLFVYPRLQLAPFLLCAFFCAGSCAWKCKPPWEAAEAWAEIWKVGNWQLQTWNTWKPVLHETHDFVCFVSLVWEELLTSQTSPEAVEYLEFNCLTSTELKKKPSHSTMSRHLSRSKFKWAPEPIVINQEFP